MQESSVHRAGLVFGARRCGDMSHAHPGAVGGRGAEVQAGKWGWVGVGLGVQLAAIHATKAA